MEQKFQYNQSEPQIIQEEYQTERKSSLLFYIIGGVVFVIALIIGTFILFGDLFQSTKANIRLQTAQGTFSEEFMVGQPAQAVLVWDSVNAKTCQITSSADGQTIEVSTNEKDNGFKSKISKLIPNTITSVLNPSAADVPMYLPKEIPIHLNSGEEVTYILTCDNVEDTIKVTPKYLTLADFEKAENRWLDRFDTSNIPTDSFKAFYFDKNNPKEVLKTEIVPKVNINYFSSDGPGFEIDSEDFGGYWIGNVTIEKAGIYSIFVRQGWSEERVIIDGYEIPIDGEIKVDFEKGTYQVEIEFLNNYHSTDFMMTIEPEKEKLTADELKARIDTENNTYDVWYVYGYDENPTLNISKEAKRPTIIFIESYEPTQWVIKNAAENNIEYIVYASLLPGATVKSDLSEDHIFLVHKDVIQDPNSAGGAGVEARCWTDNYPPRCDNVYTVSNLDRFAKEFSGGSLTGFTALSDSDERLSVVDIPRVTLTPTKIAEILAANEKIKAEAEAQAKKEAASVETLFSD